MDLGGHGSLAADALEVRDQLHVLRLQLEVEHVQVFLHAVRVRGLRQRQPAHLHTPAQADLADAPAVLLRKLLHLRHLEDRAGAERAVGLDKNVVLFAVHHDLRLRHAGAEAELVDHGEDEVRSELEKAVNRDDIAVILITETLVSLCPDLIYDLKLNRKQPLIVEIPDRHGNGRTKDSITKYVQDAIGVKL